MGATEDFIREKAKNVKEEDISWVLRCVGCIREKVCGPLEKFAEQIRLFIEMLCDYQSGEYGKAPIGTIGVIVCALLYILTPFDCVPDFIPLVGLIDDALVMATAVAMVGLDVQDYKLWRELKDWATRRAKDAGAKSAEGEKKD